VNRVRLWIATLWPLALLVVFLATFRRGGDESGGDHAPPDCEDARVSDITTVERCLELDPLNVELIADAGDEYFSAGDSDRAETLYRRALSIDPHDGDVHLRLGELLMMRGDAAAAQTHGEAALASRPGSLTARRLIERAAALRSTQGAPRSSADSAPGSPRSAGRPR
jgi:thioredoxin-like negative regulator of GroEL